MATRRRVSSEDGRSALATWTAAQGTDEVPAPRQVVATAVRWTTEELATRAPGRSVEVRVPPFAAVQCVEGPVHTRGTPPAVVETDPQTWLELVTGRLVWAEAVAKGALRVSGRRTDLSAHLPLT